MSLQAIHRPARGARFARIPSAERWSQAVKESQASRIARLCWVLSPYRISWACLLEVANFQTA